MPKPTTPASPRTSPWKTAALATAAGAAAVAAYTILIEPRWLEVTRTRVPISRLPAGLNGFRVALLSDLHAGKGTPMWLLRRACRLAMRERPDLIALTGDFMSDESAVTPMQVAGALSTLDAPLGVFAVPGNHDHAWGIDAWREAMRAHSEIVDLTNKALIHEYRGARVGIAGVDDFATGDPDLHTLDRVRNADLTILLAHNPDQAEPLRRTDVRVDLVLSGHTHAGQVRFPFVGALRNPARHADIYEEGLTPRPWTQVYISRGIGTIHLPIRLLARPEVAILDLVPA